VRIPLSRASSLPPSETSVGDPIAVEKNPNPTEKDIVELRDRFCVALQALFEKHKAAYGLPDETLLFVDSV
jgi:hypothetical protein